MSATIQQHPWLQPYFRVLRARLTLKDATVRTVSQSEIIAKAGDVSLARPFSDVIPLFYRDVEAITKVMRDDGFFTSPMQDTLKRLPTAESFQSSHAAEVIACLFAEHALGLRRIYSKLSLLTAQNANAFKMDVVLYDPRTNPVDIVFMEVKSSAKHARDGLPAEHHKSCFADVFASMNKYQTGDLQFDLSAANDRLRTLPKADRERVRAALAPYSAARHLYAATVVIDSSTLDLSEAALLAKRKNKKQFDVDVICVEEFRGLVTDAYGRLAKLRDACLP